MKRRTLLGAVGAGVAAAGGMGILGRDLVGTAQAQEAAAREIPEMTLGSDDAPVEFIEYASFTCPHCATFHTQIMPLLKADYIDQGSVRFVYREVYFDRFGLWASMVARCAGPVRFFGVTDLLYESQRDWTQGDPATVAENLRRVGRTVGLGEDELESCLTDGQFAQDLVARYESHMEEHEIPGTPAFVINGQLHGNMSYAEMQSLLDGLIAAAEG
ncbi:MAG: DsbA family protein [Pseudomonadota bacterium]